MRFWVWQNCRRVMIFDEGYGITGLSRIADLPCSAVMDDVRWRAGLRACPILAQADHGNLPDPISLIHGPAPYDNRCPRQVGAVPCAPITNAGSDHWENQNPGLCKIEDLPCSAVIDDVRWRAGLRTRPTLVFDEQRHNACPGPSGAWTRTLRAACPPFQGGDFSNGACNFFISCTYNRLSASFFSRERKP